MCFGLLLEVTYTFSYEKVFSDADIIILFKAHILSYIEYRTAGIFHASDSVLAPLNNVLKNLLRDINMSELDALVHFHLAPLNTRRDIAVLGAVHRAVLGRGPEELKDFFTVSSSGPTRIGLRSVARRHAHTLVGTRP